MTIISPRFAGKFIYNGNDTAPQDVVTAVIPTDARDSFRTIVPVVEQATADLVITSDYTDGMAGSYESFRIDIAPNDPNQKTFCVADTGELHNMDAPSKILSTRAGFSLGKLLKGQQPFYWREASVWGSIRKLLQPYLPK